MAKECRLDQPETSEEIERIACLHALDSAFEGILRALPPTGARLIQPNGRETTVYPIQTATGFSHQEIVHLVGEPYETFLLPGGSLRPTPLAGLRNKTATELLRLARDHPRDAVRAAMHCCFMPMRSRNTALRETLGEGLGPWNQNRICLAQVRERESRHWGCVVGDRYAAPFLEGWNFVLAWNQTTRTEPEREQYPLFKRLGEFLTNRLDVGRLLRDLALEQPREPQPIPIDRSPPNAYVPLPPDASCRGTDRLLP